MREVVQNDKSRTRLRRLLLGGCAATLATAALLAGCAGPDSAGSAPVRRDPAQALGPEARQAAEHARLAAAARRWGLDRAPLTPPPPPAKKPRITARAGFEVDHQEDWNLPPVFTTVPTEQKVVFLTIDDGAEKDPRFLAMMRELGVPYTAFLSNYLVKDDYAYFRAMKGYGNTLNNHTLHHPYLPGLSYEEQRDEICGMQDIMKKQFGKAPTVFRPPYGNYNQDTLVAAKSCGIKYAPIWNEEVFVDHWEYREDDQRLRRGDIVLTHFRGRDDWNGTMVDDMRRFLNKVTREGYAVARLEDYL
ncbi:Peptidoglycan/xylan/chitin deacetylase, PgdA/CDA1 family [Streptomyces sp. 1222.5]|uniref:polysaccharide deacetylase family protein n=1 Tax=unclassified Streptomyces TaxID=2593676 RepID=UPI0008972B39|nr:MULTISPECIES: polysaccharide deacetylase family protein [unclassified Streptomyces]PKW09523.1 peptidoglycan/xylan/chitin deacetylase (PgdA/CDA1 family) [Streptomyces sp. 5112.2]SEC32527.1 Peptidoglycan/xylan/chitin deacetylase, PgdA/CDA1 family [Streptomyces sp. 1222.5]